MKPNLPLADCPTFVCPAVYSSGIWGNAGTVGSTAKMCMSCAERCLCLSVMFLPRAICFILEFFSRSLSYFLIL